MAWWHSLLVAHNERSGFGLTPSFVLGASRILEGRSLENLIKADLTDLLMQISAQAPPDTYPRISRCPGLGLPVLSLATGSMAGMAVQDVDGDPMRLHCLPDVVLPPAALADLVEALWAEFGVAIESGRYSRIEGEFAGFSHSDLEFIESVRWYD